MGIVLAIVILVTAAAVVVKVGIMLFNEPLEKPRLDPRKINEAELELGLGLSNYGKTTVAVIESVYSAVIRENQRVIDKLEETLDPVAHLEKQVGALEKRIAAVHRRRFGEAAVHPPNIYPLDAPYPPPPHVLAPSPHVTGEIFERHSAHWDRRIISYSDGTKLTQMIRHT